MGRGFVEKMTDASYVTETVFPDADGTDLMPEEEEHEAELPLVGPDDEEVLDQEEEWRF